MRKSKIRRPEPADLVLQSVAPDDCSLPKPRGSKVQKIGSFGETQLAKSRLEQTRAFGLVSIVTGTQYWRCHVCGRIGEESRCCGVLAAQVVICKSCLQIHGVPMRIGECRCRKRK